MRIVSIALMFVGVLLIVTYLVEPLRFLWWWFRHMPLPLQIGFSVAGLGLVILFTTMLFERYSLRSYDKNLLES